MKRKSLYEGPNFSKELMALDRKMAKLLVPVIRSYMRRGYDRREVGWALISAVTLNVALEGARGRK